MPTSIRWPSAPSSSSTNRGEQIRRLTADEAECGYGPTVRNPGRDVLSYTAGELAEMPALDLCGIAMKAEEESAALWREHQDVSGQVPADVEARARRLARVGALCEYLAREGG